MRCPKCHSDKSRCIRTTSKLTDDGDDFNQRRRVCRDCGYRYDTFESHELSDTESAFRLEEAKAAVANLGKILETSPV